MPMLVEAAADRSEALRHIPAVLRVIAVIFSGFAVLNMFIFWSFPHWWPAPRTWGDWILMIIAMLAWLPQALSYIVFDLLEKLRHFGGVESLVVPTLLSTMTYAPIVLWRRDQRRAAEQRVAADESGLRRGPRR